MTTFNETLSELRRIGVKQAAYSILSGMGVAALVGAAMMLYSLGLVVIYEVLVNAGVPMDEPSTDLLMLRFPVEVPVVAALSGLGAMTVRAFGGGISIRDTALVAAGVYALVWVALLAAGVETTWVL